VTISSDSGGLRRILVVDDEANIVSAVTRELTAPPFGRYRYEVEGFTDPTRALARAKVQPFDLVVADYRMPEMDGIAFLRALADIQPDCAVIVLSAQTDMQALIKMVNQTHIYRFVPKPWHGYFLKGSILQALDYHGVLLENRRLADSVKAHNIRIPSLVPETDRILLVHTSETLLARLARELSSRSEMDELFAAIRSEIHQLPPVTLDEGKLSVHVASSPHDALKMAGDAAYSCLITAYTLPRMSGIDLLEAFADKQPDCARLLISDGMTMDQLISVIDLVHVSGVLTAPLREFEMKMVVAQALARRRTVIHNRVLAGMLQSAPQ